MSSTTSFWPFLAAQAPAILKAKLFGSIGEPSTYLALQMLRFKKRQGYFLPRILYMPVPQVGHLPLTAARPFFMVTFCSSFISLLALHFTQYPFSAI
jgi:hypothetical protein